jgi:hypothetical protein
MPQLSASQLQGLKSSLAKVDKLNKVKGTTDAISMAGEVAGQIITVVYAVRNERERKRCDKILEKIKSIPIVGNNQCFVCIVFVNN